MKTDLFKKIVDLTQLPADEISQELERILDEQGVRRDRVTLGELREALSQYMHEVFSQYKLVMHASDSDVEDADDLKVSLLN